MVPFDVDVKIESYCQRDLNFRKQRSIY